MRQIEKNGLNWVSGSVATPGRSRRFPGPRRRGSGGTGTISWVSSYGQGAELARQKVPHRCFSGMGHLRGPTNLALSAAQTSGVARPTPLRASGTRGKVGPEHDSPSPLQGERVGVRGAIAYRT